MNISIIRRKKSGIGMLMADFWGAVEMLSLFFLPFLAGAGIANIPIKGNVITELLQIYLFKNLSINCFFY